MSRPRRPAARAKDVALLPVASLPLPSPSEHRAGPQPLAPPAPAAGARSAQPAVEGTGPAAAAARSGPRARPRHSLSLSAHRMPPSRVPDPGSGGPAWGRGCSAHRQRTAHGARGSFRPVAGLRLSVSRFLPPTSSRALCPCNVCFVCSSITESIGRWSLCPVSLQPSHPYG